MHFLFPVMVGLAATTLAQAATVPAPPGQRHGLAAGNDCPNATSHFARNGGIWSGDPVRPRKLTELPPANTYAAVYRLDERGCMVQVMYPGTRARRP